MLGRSLLVGAAGVVVFLVASAHGRAADAVTLGVTHRTVGFGGRVSDWSLAMDVTTPADGTFDRTLKLEKPAVFLARGTDNLMYDSLFFVRDFAIHGYCSVPSYPASHGCVRTPLWFASGIYARWDVGTSVYVFA